MTIGSLQPFGVASGEVNVIHRHKLAIPKMFPNRLSWLVGYALKCFSIHTARCFSNCSFHWLQFQQIC